VMMKILGQLKAETNVEKLKENLKGLEARASETDPKRRVFLDMFRKKLAARIEELQKK
jgi:hypothetical protein